MGLQAKAAAAMLDMAVVPILGCEGWSVAMVALWVSGWRTRVIIYDVSQAVGLSCVVACCTALPWGEVLSASHCDVTAFAGIIFRLLQLRSTSSIWPNDQRHVGVRGTLRKRRACSASGHKLRKVGGNKRGLG